MDLETLQQYERDGLLRSQSHPTLPLTIWNYTETVQYSGLWDDITLQCRGLVTDNHDIVVARPFRKFFNIEEGKYKPTQDFEVYEKMDGSLGIMFLYEGEMVCATRGSFTSDQAAWMSKFAIAHNYQNIIVEGFTYLYEIIFPENRIVVDYGRDERLVLLGIIKTRTGEEMPYDDILFDGWDIVKKYDGISDYSALKGLIKDNQEGFVIKFSNGDRIKIKGEEYVRLHKVMTNLSTTAIWEVLSNNGSVDVLLKDVPDELYNRIKEYENFLIDTFWLYESHSKSLFRSIYKDGMTAKSFSEFANKQRPPYQSLLWCQFNIKMSRYSEIIWKHIKPKFIKL